MTETEGEHRRATESLVLKGAFAEGRFGQVCAVIVALAGISASAYVGSSGHEVTGSILGGATMVMLTGIHYVTDGKGKLVAVQIDLKKHGRLWLKARLTLQIYKTIKARKLTQVQAGVVLGIKQPHVSSLMRGQSGAFSV